MGEDGLSVHNWGGSIVSRPAVIVRPSTIEEIAAIVTDRARYPAPVRATGSNHSTTACATADGGTLVEMRGLDRIKQITADSVTVEAGALYIDVSHELRRHGLQFFVNVEIGNLTIGSAACGGTKDASMPGEFGQVSSYAVGIRVIAQDGSLLEFDERDPERLQAARSSYGLFGIVVEATFRVRPLRALEVRHRSFAIPDFAKEVADLPPVETSAPGAESVMYYLMPYLDRVVVEYRRYADTPPGEDATAWQWRLRNWAWSVSGPYVADHIVRWVPQRRLRYLLIDLLSRIISLTLVWVIRGRRTVPTDQTIRYPETGGPSKYTFSIWAFPEERYAEALEAYVAWAKRTYETTGYRPNLTHVGYRIAADREALFSYSFDGPVMTIDPVSTGDEGWEGFIEAYNEFCSAHGGVPLFNQTIGVTADQARRAFGERLARFETLRRRYDPDDRFLSPYFRELLGIGGTGEAAPPRSP